jgi:hypothetical protein
MGVSKAWDGSVGEGEGWKDSASDSKACDSL